MHTLLAQYTESTLYAIYNISELYRSRRAMARSHVSLFVLFGPIIGNAFTLRNHEGSRIKMRAGYSALSETGHVNEIAYTSTPRTTKHLCVWHIFVPFAISRKYNRIRLVMALRWRRHTTLLNYFRGKTKLVRRRNLFSRLFNFAVNDFFFEREKENFTRENRI